MALRLRRFPIRSSLTLQYSTILPLTPHQGRSRAESNLTRALVHAPVRCRIQATPAAGEPGGEAAGEVLAEEGMSIYPSEQTGHVYRERRSANACKADAGPPAVRVALSDASGSG